MGSSMFGCWRILTERGKSVRSPGVKPAERAARVFPKAKGRPRNLGDRTEAATSMNLFPYETT
jgi:hypothetical protein